MGKRNNSKQETCSERDTSFLRGKLRPTKNCADSQKNVKEKEKSFYFCESAQIPAKKFHIEIILISAILMIENDAFYKKPERT